MITLLTGDNTFEIDRALGRIIAEFDGDAERIDGSNLQLRQLPDLLMGATLFADKRLVIIKNLSENKPVWTDFYQWIPRLSDDIHLVLVESKPDKRMVTYKDLKKSADVIELATWADRDASKAASWVMAEAAALGLTMDNKSVQHIVSRVGVDQWQLYYGLQKLALVDEITTHVIDDIIDANPAENVFNLFDSALRGDRAKIAQMIRTLELTEDPYRLFALLSGQAFQLAAVAVSTSSDHVASDFGVHPFVLSKLESAAKKQGRAGARKIINIFAKADDDMKLSRAEPWLLIERALLQTASL